MLNRSTTWAVVLLVATFGYLIGSREANRSPLPPQACERLDSVTIPEYCASPTASSLWGQTTRDTVHAILQRHWARMTEVWETVRPRFDSMRAQMDSEILRQLAVDQQVKYRDHMARRRHQKDKADSGGRRP